MWPGGPFVNESHDADSLLGDNETGHDASFEQRRGGVNPGYSICMRGTGIAPYAICPRQKCAVCSLSLIPLLEILFTPARRM